MTYIKLLRWLPLLGIFILLNCFITNSLQAQQISVIASLDTNKILIGGQTKLNLTATTSITQHLQWPVLKDSIQKIEIVNIGKVDTTLSADKKFATYTQSITITCFDSGFKAIAPIQFAYKIVNDTTTQRLGTDALLLQVQGLVVDTTLAIKDIKPPLEIPFSIIDFVKEYWPYFAAILAIIAFIIWWFKFRKKSTAAIPDAKPEPTRPADVIAIEQLQQLEQKKLWQEGSTKLYHSELADIVRTYLENRYSIMAMELTTEETLAGLKILDQGNKEKLKQLLVLADFVKFAKAEPIHFENELSLKHAYEFVKSTKATTVKTDIK